MRRLHLTLRALVIFAVILGLLWTGYALLRQRPQDLPWTKLDLAQPVGLFTGRKLAALTGDRAQCLALLEQAGVAYTPMQRGGGEGQCGYADAVRLKGERGAIGLSPAGVAPSCPVAAALRVWEWQVVQPAAQRLFGQPVRSITHFGSYSCRRMYGRSQGDFSEHATADAIDISGFTLADGRRISVIGDWKGQGKDAAFLHAVRDGACGLFSTVLSPDYNAAHRDHFHLDQAERGATGWRACR
ncbi:extensin family protein [Sphingobium sp. AP49]|uniref:extensin-like domain-containing protein n=1 Tax=Sphingobium sp. AP49 TaxID=1144307 RepID=UPI00026EE4DB|nr:extensin family protein [Sphingobium sp. AP49]WHO40360.1 extensin family protein [Sphingobium sp. AP49]